MGPAFFKSSKLQLRWPPEVETRQPGARPSQPHGQALGTNQAKRSVQFREIDSASVGGICSREERCGNEDVECYSRLDLEGIGGDGVG
jgi:hypothetical protein